MNIALELRHEAAAIFRKLDQYQGFKRKQMEELALSLVKDARRYDRLTCGTGRRTVRTHTQEAL